MIKNIKNIYFIGIGGIGMSGIAEILFYKGYQIKGSDIVYSSITKKLIRIGIQVIFTHSTKNIIGADIIIISNAISQDNLEIIEAKKLGIPIIKRIELLSKLINCHYSIVVTGTHGKTTTTAMITDLYIKNNSDPTFIIGGLMKLTNTYAKLGNSNYMITEIDESDPLFVKIKPTIVVITNIDNDHLNNYKNSFNEIKKKFIKFIYNLPSYSKIIMCIDDPIIYQLLPKIDRYIITYGFNKNANLRIINFIQKKKVFLLLKEKIN